MKIRKISVGECKKGQRGLFNPVCVGWFCHNLSKVVKHIFARTQYESATFLKLISEMRKTGKKVEDCRLSPQKMVLFFRSSKKWLAKVKETLAGNVKIIKVFFSYRKISLKIL
jgi:hypothetical protein